MLRSSGYGTLAASSSRSAPIVVASPAAAIASNSFAACAFGIAAASPIAAAQRAVSARSSSAASSVRYAMPAAECAAVAGHGLMLGSCARRSAIASARAIGSSAIACAAS